MTVFGRIWVAETRKLLSRPAAKVALVLAVALGALGPLLLRLVASAGVTVNGGDLGASLDVSAPNAVRWALVLRGFFVGQGFVALLATASLAGELQAHTLREDVARPVSRRVVLLAKWAALAVLSALWLLLQGAAGSVLGVILHPSTGAATWANVGLGHLAAFATDVSFAAVALACAAVLRSPAAAVLALVLGVVVERFVAGVAWAVRGIALASPDLPGWATWFLHATPLLPSSAWSVWSEVANGASVVPATWGALLGWTLLAALVAERSFAAADIP